MALNRHIIIYFIMLSYILGATAWATVKIKGMQELIAKQDLTNIRFFSRDGKFVYYQRKSGDLVFSTNYAATTILKGQENTQYFITATIARKKILIIQDEEFHTDLNLRGNRKIYAVDFGGNKPIHIGYGINPKLHLDDQLASFFDPLKKSIQFIYLNNDGVSFEIKLFNKINPFFIPQVAALDKNRIIFTDLNNEGFPGLILFKKSDNTIRPIFKSSGPLYKIELCQSYGQLYFGQFAIDHPSQGSLIAQAFFDEKDTMTTTPIYSSNNFERGNLICDISKNEIFFIKTDTNSFKKQSYDVAKITIDQKKVDSLTTLSDVGQIISLDGILLLPYQGKTYVMDNTMPKINDALGSGGKN